MLLLDYEPKTNSFLVYNEEDVVVRRFEANALGYKLLCGWGEDRCMQGTSLAVEVLYWFNPSAWCMATRERGSQVS